MSKLTILLTLVLCAARIAAAETFVTGSFIDGAARMLQAKLPACARFDGLVEARRGSAEWSYAFWKEADKRSATEVRVKLLQLNAHSTEVTVEVVKVEGGLFFDNEDPLPTESHEWTTRISTLLDAAPGNDACADLEKSW